MKPIKSRIILMLAVLTGLCSCQVAELSSGRHDVGDVSFSIDDAREFFETDYSAFRTKGQDNALPSRFSPGDYTPMWEDAEYSVSGSCAAYDVAVLPERSLVAIRSEFGMNGARAERLRVYQKLVVMKNTASGVMGSYILSLIPDVGSDDRRIPQRFLSRGADKGGFSGIAVYTSSSSGSLHSVQQFKDGVKVRGVNLDNDKGSRLVRCRKAMSILSGIVILSKKSVTTKAGEDMWDDWYDDGWDYGDADDYTYIGDGIYEDENGDLYMDIDGDGVIDAFLLEGSECTPEPDEEDKEKWPEGDEDWPKDEQPTLGSNDDSQYEPEIPPSVDESISPPTNESVSQVTQQELIGGIKKSVATIIELYGTQKAYCNQGVRLAFNNIFLDSELPNVCANDIVRYWLNNPAQWNQISLQDAIRYANDGYFVVAGWINNSGSGHVVVIVPGDTSKGNWNGEYIELPKAMDTGYNRREESIGINYCFGKNKHAEVVFFKYNK